MTPEGSDTPRSVAIVTGISRGYGKAVADSLLSSDWSVVGDGRDEIALTAAVSHLGGGERLKSLHGDVRDEDHLQGLVSRAVSMGPLELVVNNASTLGPTPLPQLADLTQDDLAETFRVNTLAPLRLLQVALPELEANGGAVINITSDASVEAYEGWGGYGASKAALDHLTSVLAVENPKISFYSLDPGDMRTDMHQAAFPGEDISDRPLPEVSAPAVTRLALDRPPSGRYRAVDLL